MDLTRPLAVAFALIPIAAGALSLFGIGLVPDALHALVPDWLFIALAVTYIGSGTLLLFGITTKRGNYEAAGCVLLISSLVVRAISTTLVFGIGPGVVVLDLLYLGTAFCCLARLRQLVWIP